MKRIMNTTTFFLLAFFFNIKNIYSFDHSPFEKVTAENLNSASSPESSCEENSESSSDSDSEGKKDQHPDSDHPFYCATMRTTQNQKEIPFSVIAGNILKKMNPSNNPWGITESEGAFEERRERQLNSFTSFINSINERRNPSLITLQEDNEGKLSKALLHKLGNKWILVNFYQGRPLSLLGLTSKTHGVTTILKREYFNESKQRQIDAHWLSFLGENKFPHIKKSLYRTNPILLKAPNQQGEHRNILLFNIHLVGETPLEQYAQTLGRFFQKIQSTYSVTLSNLGFIIVGDFNTEIRDKMQDLFNEKFQQKTQLAGFGPLSEKPADRAIDGIIVSQCIRMIGAGAFNPTSKERTTLNRIGGERETVHLFDPSKKRKIPLQKKEKEAETEEGNKKARSSEEN